MTKPAEIVYAESRLKMEFQSCAYSEERTGYARNLGTWQGVCLNTRIRSSELGWTEGLNLDWEIVRDGERLLLVLTELRYRR